MEEAGEGISPRSPGVFKRTSFNGDDDVSNKRMKPLAELYSDATILFGDLAGFTSWSSQRDPSHVFLLLETLFKAFDAAAIENQIYKVETVGGEVADDFDTCGLLAVFIIPLTMLTF